MLENCLRSIGTMSGVDGAIVMDYACNVLAFNAIIPRPPEGVNHARLVDTADRLLTSEEVVGDRGSRHQSALAYVMGMADSFAFVISQDAGVTAFHNRGDATVVCERRLRVLD
jgi:hypothetical protein